MALSDPQSLTLGSAIPLPRVVTDAKSATYRAGDQNLELLIEHSSNGKTNRSVMRATQRKVAADPLTAVNSYQFATVTLTINRPVTGFTEAELLLLLNSIPTWGSASTNAKFKQILGMES